MYVLIMTSVYVLEAGDGEAMACSCGALGVLAEEEAVACSCAISSTFSASFCALVAR